MMPEGWRAVDPMEFEIKNLEPEELVQLDYQHIQQCQAVLARVYAPTWGTAMELAYAKRLLIPVLAWSNAPKMSKSPWLVAHVHKYFPSLREACMELQYVDGI